MSPVLAARVPQGDANASLLEPLDWTCPGPGEQVRWRGFPNDGAVNFIVIFFPLCFECLFEERVQRLEKERLGITNMWDGVDDR